MLKDQDIIALTKFLEALKTNNNPDSLNHQQADFLLMRIDMAQHGYKNEDNTCP